MSCNCKRAREIEEKYGEEQEESLFWKGYRFLWKIIFNLILIVLAIIVTPIIIFMVLYNIVVGRENILMLPKQLRKYLE